MLSFKIRNWSNRKLNGREKVTNTLTNSTGRNLRRIYMLGATLETVGRGVLCCQEQPPVDKGCWSQDTTVCNCHYTNCSDKDYQRMLIQHWEKLRREYLHGLRYSLK